MVVVVVVVVEVVGDAVGDGDDADAGEGSVGWDVTLANERGC